MLVHASGKHNIDDAAYGWPYIAGNFQQSKINIYIFKLLSISSQIHRLINSMPLFDLKTREMPFRCYPHDWINFGYERARVSPSFIIFIPVNFSRHFVRIFFRSLSSSIKSVFGLNLEIQSNNFCVTKMMRIESFFWISKKFH